MSRQKEATVDRVYNVSLPAKHLVVQLMSDGSVNFAGYGTEYAASHAARSISANSVKVKAQDFVRYATAKIFNLK